MKPIAPLPSCLSVLLCVAVLGVGIACGSSLLYLRNPALDKAEVHTERIGGSFAYQTSELLAYSPIVPCPLPFTINYQHSLSVLLPRPGVPAAADVDVTTESQPASKPEPEALAPATDEPIPLDDDDTVAVDAAIK